MSIKPMAPLSGYLQSTQPGWRHENLRKVHEQIGELAETISDNKEHSMGDLDTLQDIPKFEKCLSHLEDAVSETEKVLDQEVQEKEKQFPNTLNEDLLELLELIEMTPSEREAYLSNKKAKQLKSIDARKSFDIPLDIEDKLIVILNALAHALEVTAGAVAGTTVAVDSDLIDPAIQLLNDAAASKNKKIDGRLSIDEMTLDQLVIFEDMMRSSVLEPYLHTIAHMLNTTWEQVAVGALEMQEKNEHTLGPKPPSPYD